jgi:hypothetical protein
MQIPKGMSVIQPILHPVDGQPGMAIKFSATGVEAFFDGCAIRSLPRDWRKSQRPDALGMPVARTITNTYGG